MDANQSLPSLTAEELLADKAERLGDRLYRAASDVLAMDCPKQQGEARATVVACAGVLDVALASISNMLGEVGL